jgi:hypothetical protein
MSPPSLLKSPTLVALLVVVGFDVAHCLGG